MIIIYVSPNFSITNVCVHKYIPPMMTYKNIRTKLKLTAMDTQRSKKVSQKSVTEVKKMQKGSGD